MTSIIKKRRSLHKTLDLQKEQNDTLKMQIAQLQALANIGVTTSMIAHEINNLLTPLGNYAQLALNNPNDEALAKKALQKTVKNSQRACKVTESILAVASGRKNEKQETGLLDLVEEIFSCLARDFSKDKISVNIHIDKDLKISGVAIQIQQVIMNLILNARQAMLDKGGTLTINASQVQDNVTISVTDTGSGIEAANMKKIFEPFFSTKQKSKNTDISNSGSGIGLAFCKKIISEHKGTISVESTPNQYTAFTITLPEG